MRADVGKRRGACSVVFRKSDEKKNNPKLHCRTLGSRCGEIRALECEKKRRGACSVVFRESDGKKIIQNCTAAHSAVGAGNSVRADATKCRKKTVVRFRDYC